MLFTERFELEKEYYKWIDEHEEIADNAFSVITFLDSIGVLKPLNKRIVKFEKFNKEN